MAGKEERGASDSTNKGTVSQCIPNYSKLYFLEVYQVLCGKSKSGLGQAAGAGEAEALSLAYTAAESSLISVGIYLTIKNEHIEEMICYIYII